MLLMGYICAHDGMCSPGTQTAWQGLAMPLPAQKQSGNLRLFGLDDALIIQLQTTERVEGPLELPGDGCRPVHSIKWRSEVAQKPDLALVSAFTSPCTEIFPTVPCAEGAQGVWYGR